MLTNVMSAAVDAATHIEEHAALAFPAWAYAGALFALLLIGMFITVSFSNVGKRHEAVDQHNDPHRQHPANHDVPGN